MTGIPGVTGGAAPMALAVTGGGTKLPAIVNKVKDVAPVVIAAGTALSIAEATQGGSSRMGSSRYDLSFFQNVAQSMGFDPGVAGPGIVSSKDVTPGYYGDVVKSWSANGVTFQQNTDGTISVLKKNGMVKTYRPYKPTVFGKNPDAKKFIKVAKNHQKMYKELHKVFGKKSCRK